MNKPEKAAGAVAAGDDLARLKAELEAAVRERDDHRIATLYMLEDLEQDRKRIERSREEWVRVFDGVRDPIFVHDPDFRILRCNRAYAQRAGMSIQQVIGKPYWEVFPKRDGPLPGCVGVEEAEGEVRLDSGDIFLSRSFPVNDAAGAFLFAVHIMDDITERKRVEEAIVKAGDEFHMLFDAIADAIFIADTEGRFLQVNHSACRRLGYSREELLRMGAAGIDAPEYAAQLPERIKAIQQRGQLVFESAHVHKDGRVIPIELSVRLVDYGGGPALLSVARDITERKAYEARIEHLNRLIRSARNINRLLTSEKDRGSLLQFACDILVREAGYRMAWIGIVRQGQPEVVPMAKSGIGAAGYLESITVTCDDTPTGRGPAGTAIRTREPSIIQDIARDPRFTSRKDIALQNGYRGCASFPLLSDNTIYGVVNLYAGTADAFDAEEIALLKEVADDIAFALRGMDIESDRKNAERARRDSEEMLRRSLEDTIRAIGHTVEMRDPYTAGHQRRVADLAAAIAKELGLPLEQIHGLHLAGIVHDLGKVSIPAEILSKPGKITDIEFTLIKAHPQAGYDILKDVEFPWPIAQTVLQHHERLDGSGYPQGLKAEQILLDARILAVADVVEAMASHRPYRASLGIDKALAEIEQGRGRAYDPASVDACVKLFREKGFTFAN